MSISRRTFLKAIGAVSLVGTVLKRAWAASTIPSFGELLKELLEKECPPGCNGGYIGSSGAIGTAYGRYLAECYYREVRFQTWILADWWYYPRAGSPYDFGPVPTFLAVSSNAIGMAMPDTAVPYVHRQLVLIWSALSRQAIVGGGTGNNRVISTRPDILDPSLFNVYEIKPDNAVQRAEGIPQLQGYIDVLNQQAPSGTAVRWSGGSWDPAPYVVVIPAVGPAGSGPCFAVIYARRDPSVRGLLLYSIKLCCCGDPSQDTLNMFAVKARVARKLRMRPEFQSLRREFEAAVTRTLPLAPANSSYVLLVPPRIWEAASWKDVDLTEYRRELDEENWNETWREVWHESKIAAAGVVVVAGGALAVVAISEALLAAFLADAALDLTALSATLAADASVAAGATVEAAEVQLVVEATLPQWVGTSVAKGAAEYAEMLTAQEFAQLSAVSLAQPSTDINWQSLAEADYVHSLRNPARPPASFGVGAITPRSQPLAKPMVNDLCCISMIGAVFQTASSGTTGGGPKGILAGLDPLMLVPVQLLQGMRAPGWIHNFDLGAAVSYGDHPFRVVGTLTLSE